MDDPQAPNTNDIVEVRANPPTCDRCDSPCMEMLKEDFGRWLSAGAVPVCAACREEEVVQRLRTAASQRGFRLGI